MLVAGRCLVYGLSNFIAKLGYHSTVKNKVSYVIMYCHIYIFFLNNNIYWINLNDNKLITEKVLSIVSTVVGENSKLKTHASISLASLPNSLFGSKVKNGRSQIKSNQNQKWFPWQCWRTSAMMALALNAFGICQSSASLLLSLVCIFLHIHI